MPGDRSGQIVPWPSMASTRLVMVAESTDARVADDTGMMED